MANEKSEVELELEELAKADDGSDFEGEDEGEGEDAGDETPRDAKSGKFVKAEAKAETKKTEKADGKKAEGAKASGKKAAAADESESEESEESEDDDDAAEDEDDGDDADEDGDEDEEGDEPSTAKGKSVPLSRFTKAIAAKNALLQRVADLEAQTKKDDKKDDSAAVALKARIDKLYEDVEEARADNDTKKAAALQRELDEILAEQSELRVRKAAREESRATSQETEFDNLAAFIERERPIVDPDSPEYDERVAESFNFHVDAYMKNGDSPVKAIRRASAMIFEVDPLRPAKAAVTPKEDPKVVGKKKTDVKKNADAAKRQPPKTDGAAQPADGKKLSVKQLSDAEFDALPESKKKELGGDFLEVD